MSSRFRSQGRVDGRPPIETMEYLGMLSRLIRAAGRRVADADEPELARLIQIRDEVDAAITVGVKGQRALGRSWSAIALATGATRQAAHQRWGGVS